MVLSVNYSSGAILGFTVVVGGAICTALYLRSRNNATPQPIDPLNKERVSLTGIPTIDRVYNFINPPIPPLEIGNRFKPLKSDDELLKAGAAAGKQHQICETIIIYGKHLNICEDSPILELKPKKLILVGPGNNITTKVSWSSTRVWNVGIITTRSIGEALNADPSDLTKNEGHWHREKPKLIIYQVDCRLQ